MTWLQVIASRIRELFAKRRLDAELDEELQTHLEMLAEENAQRGMSADDARRSARIALGGREQIKEAVREHRGLPLLESIVADIRFGVRMLRKNLGLTVVAVLTLGLGIGANTAVFSVVNAVLLRPLPYPNANRLVLVWEKTPQARQSGLSVPDFLDYRDGNQVFEKLAVFVNGDFTLLGGDSPVAIRGAAVTNEFFGALGARPFIGRAFLQNDEQLANSHVAILSFDLWQRRFAADPQILGKTINLNDTDYVVVGVLGPTFEFAVPGFFRRAADVWVPFVTGYPQRSRSNHFLRVIATRRPDISPEQAQANMETIAQRLGREYPGTNRDETIQMVPFKDAVIGNSRPALLILLGAVAFVLMIAGGNVAGLLLSRAADRWKEFALIGALGAGRWRIARRLLVESILLSSAGGCFGVLLAYWSIPLIKWLSPINTPRLNDANIDSRVLLFTLAVCFLTSLIIGIAPIRSALRLNLSDALNDRSHSPSSPGRDRIRALLITSEVAASVVLLIGAGLLIRSFASLTMTNPGFQSEHVMSTVLSLPRTRYPDQSRQLAFFENVLDRIRTIPGVAFAATINDLPQGGDRDSTGIVIAGQLPATSAQQPQVDYRIVSSDYFPVMQIASLEGRSFTVSDTGQSAPVVIVNEAFVRRFFPHDDPIGKYILANFDLPHPAPLAREIVGIVGNVRDLKMSTPPEPEIYAPVAQEPTSYAIVVVRSLGNPLQLAPQIRSSVWAIDKDQPLSEMLTMDQVLSESVAPERFQSTLLGAFGVTALFLAAIGIYGLFSYQVNQCTHEIGIRMALGAQKRDILRMVTGGGIKLTLVGVCIGVAGALALTRLLSGLLYSITPTDPITFVSVIVLLLAVTLLACYIPARRATKVDPMSALRHE